MIKYALYLRYESPPLAPCIIIYIGFLNIFLIHLWAFNRSQITYTFEWFRTFPLTYFLHYFTIPLSTWIIIWHSCFCCFSTSLIVFDKRTNQIVMIKSEIFHIRQKIFFTFVHGPIMNAPPRTKIIHLKERFLSFTSRSS